MKLNAFFLMSLWLVAINVAAFSLFWFDKRRARLGLRRIPERTLLQFALIGGSLGALCAQQWFRHKTQKQPFRTWLVLIAMLHVAAGLLAAFRPGLLQGMQTWLPRH